MMVMCRIAYLVFSREAGGVGGNERGRENGVGIIVPGTEESARKRRSKEEERKNDRLGPSYITSFFYYYFFRLSMSGYLKRADRCCGAGV